jgi:GcrA cell cycle regulator
MNDMAHRDDLWSDARVEQLKTLYNDGLSLGRIGEQLGVTRSAVCGKVHRLKLPRRTAPPPPPRPDRRRMRIRRPPQQSFESAKIQPKSPPILDTSKQCLLYGLTNSTCRYPLWGEDVAACDQFYCGCPEANITAGMAYCPYHMAVCGGLKKNNAAWQSSSPKSLVR